MDTVKDMSDENGQEIGVNVYDDNDEDELIEDEEAAAVAPQPVEIVREEIVTVTKDSNTEDNDSEDDLYEVIKAHSDQISRLTNIVDSLQSQIKQIDQKRTSGNNKGWQRDIPNEQGEYDDDGIKRDLELENIAGNLMIAEYGSFL